MKLKKFFILLFIVGCSQAPTRRTDKLSILQGVTSLKEVEFSIVADGKRQLKFELRNDSGESISPEEIKTVTRSSSNYVVHKILFLRDQKKDYNLYAFEGPALVDQRLVGKGSLDPDHLKLIVASCMNDFDTQYQKIWEQVFKRNPDYLLLIGDNVYADRNSSGEIRGGVTPEILWDRYVDVRLNLPLYFQEKLIPTHANWDDHDYGVDDGNTAFKHKVASQEVFTAFWAQDLAEEAWRKSFGVGGLLSLGDFNLYFLDGRSFRSTSPDGTHLGTDQKAWLEAKLIEEPGPSFLIKGDQFFGGYHGSDSYEGSQPREFTEFTAELGKIDTPFIFISGDRHLSEIMQFPRGLFKKPSFEITSSPIQSIMSLAPDSLNPWRVIAEKANQNFVVIKSTAKDNHWFLDVESIGIDGRVLFQRELAVYIKDLQNNLQEVRKKRRSGKRRYRRIRGKKRR